MTRQFERALHEVFVFCFRNQSASLRRVKGLVARLKAIAQNALLKTPTIQKYNVAQELSA